MKLDIRIISVHGIPAEKSGIRGFPDDTCVAELIDLLELPREDVYAIMVNDLPVPPDERQARILIDGDKVTIFPPIQGG